VRAADDDGKGLGDDSNAKVKGSLCYISHLLMFDWTELFVPCLIVYSACTKFRFHSII
jgi:hypothetical protein